MACMVQCLVMWSIVLESNSYCNLNRIVNRGPLAPEAFMRLAWVDDFYGGDIYEAFEEAARHRFGL